MSTNKIAISEGNGAKNIATHQINEDGSDKQLQRVVISEANGTDTTIAKDGTDTTGVIQLTGGTGIRGWLSGIFKRLSETLTVSASSLPLPTGASTENTLLQVRDAITAQINIASTIWTDDSGAYYVRKDVVNQGNVNVVFTAPDGTEANPGTGLKPLSTTEKEIVKETFDVTRKRDDYSIGDILIRMLILDPDLSEPTVTSIWYNIMTDRVIPYPVNGDYERADENVTATINNFPSVQNVNLNGVVYVDSQFSNSTSQLASGATFTSSQAENVWGVPSAQIMVICDQPYTVQILQYIDQSATKLISTKKFTRKANEPLNENVQLPGNYTKISVTNNGASATTNFTLNTTFGVLPVAPQALTNRGAFPVEKVFNEDSTYLSAIAIIPTTLTTGLNYWWLRNTVSNKKIKIVKIEAILMFAGTAVASRSLYSLKKFTGCTATTGTTLSVVSGETSNPATIADTKWSATGGTLTGATIQTGDIASIGHVNQLTANIAYDRDMTDAPIVLNQNEGVVIQSNGAIVAGSTILLSVKWIEE